MHSGIMSFSDAVIITNKEQALVKPYMEIGRTKGKVQIDFDMSNQKSICIFCKRGEEEDYNLLAEVSISPYIDLRPNITPYSETREYKAQYSLNGNLIGEPDFFSIKTKGKFKFF